MSISNQDDYIDGSELAGEIETLKEAIEEKLDELVAATNSNDTRLEGQCAFDVDELREELKPLVELEDNIFFSLGDVSLISVDSFEEYAQRFAIDCGDISESSGVFAYVNWENFADSFKIDFTSVDFDGEEYLYRS